ncbi:MAG TPA: transposase [Vicinamibacterales bacterium]|nr:transposase [Vicinamibacterales bacterium]
MYHVYNRGSRKGVLFGSYDDYDAFLAILEEARARFAMRIPAYALMRTHFHFLLWPRTDSALSGFMKWLEENHAAMFHEKRRSRGTGAVYQSRFGSRPIFEDRNYYETLRYVERNPLKSGYVTRAEDWPWCSAWHGEGGPMLFYPDPPPLPKLAYWAEILNSF